MAIGLFNRVLSFTTSAIGREPDGPYIQCQTKEEFNICTAKPEGWDLSLVEKDKVCFGY